MNNKKIYTRKSTGVQYKMIYETPCECGFLTIEGVGFISIDKSLLDKEFEISELSNMNIVFKG